ncbi:DUF4004 family protein [Desmospora profundinema]|uniref:DNA-binding transcriptional MerR regulator n=1 Tax=Desmospora profundinema TaxID=1571184 RepID=A0ABU1IK44_9BACL|nr:DUF4004 family protein [Desmospora profundinema]MDR6225155.1 DNA-binding transcriptional MerR regulator [Desmospora profundinema]
MTPDLISKKELLELTGISYGQLYRWKRKKLIPEEWFIRKSTFTGQETFFPREAVLARIQKIQAWKEDRSLDEIADLLSSVSTSVWKKSELIEGNVVSEVAFQWLEQVRGERVETVSHRTVLALLVLESLLQDGGLSQNEGKIVLRLFDTVTADFQNHRAQVLLLRKGGVTTAILAMDEGKIHVDPDTEVADRIQLAKCVEKMKLDLTDGGV